MMLVALSMTLAAADQAALPQRLLPVPLTAGIAPRGPTIGERLREAAARDFGSSAKQRAFAADGSKCDVVGAMLCISRPPRLFHASFR